MKNLTTILVTVLLLGISKQSHSPKYQQGIGNHVEHVCKKYSDNSIYLRYNPYEKITIVGLGDVSLDRLRVAENIIRNFYNFRTEVKPYNMRITDEFFIDNQKETVDCDKFVRYFNPEEKVVFITNKKMWAQSMYLRGYTTVMGKVIITTSNQNMKETLIHEIGHTYGLLHCDNLTCVMAINNDNYDSGTFCDICSRNINFKR